MTGDVGWWWRANCADLPVDDFYPIEHATRQIDMVKRVCAACTVVADCLMDALESGDRFAILGGTTPKERQQLGGTA